jgi:hypothetical protein
MNIHLIPPIKLTCVLLVCILVSCKTESQTWPNCSLANEFVAEHAEGEGFDTAAAALFAHTQTQPLPGTVMLAKEEADRVTWNIYDGDRWLGKITAVTDSTGLWFVVSGAWCVEEYG